MCLFVCQCVYFLQSIMKLFITSCDPVNLGVMFIKHSGYFQMLLKRNWLTPRLVSCQWLIKKNSVFSWMTSSCWWAIFHFYSRRRSDLLARTSNKDHFQFWYITPWWKKKQNSVHEFCLSNTSSFRRPTQTIFDTSSNIQREWMGFSSKAVRNTVSILV